MPPSVQQARGRGERAVASGRSLASRVLVAGWVCLLVLLLLGCYQLGWAVQVHMQPQLQASVGNGFRGIPEPSGSGQESRLLEACWWLGQQAGMIGHTKKSAELSIIPLPAEMECENVSGTEGFQLSPSAPVHLRGEAARLEGTLRLHFQCLFGFEPAKTESRRLPGCLEIEPSSRLPPEGYTLESGTGGDAGILLITVADKTMHASLLHALQTLRQLLPTAVFGGPGVGESVWLVPKCRIRDWPRYRWRGLMLDVARHFFDLSRVKRLLLLMSMHKLNILHLHLSDDQGWRVEVSSRPELARVGGLRGPSLNRPDGDGEGGKIYNGTRYDTPRFFSKEEVQELIAFALELQIEVVPEIDVPAHAAALLVAAQSQGKVLGEVQLHEGCSDTQADQPLQAPPNCMGGTHGIILPTKEAVEYVLGAVEEVARLFPGRYFHLGGDEAEEFREEAYATQAGEELKKNLSVESSTALQGYMVDQVHRLLTKLGKTAIAWDETHFGLEDYHPPGDMLAMWWRDWSPEVSWEVVKDLGPRLILAPCSKMYMDLYQVEPHADSRYRVQEGTVPLRNTYSAAELEADGVLGVHGALWTEHFVSEKVLQYQLFPRGAAVAEVGWTPKAKAMDFDGFMHRWRLHARRLSALGVDYYDGNYTGELLPVYSFTEE